MNGPVQATLISDEEGWKRLAQYVRDVIRDYVKLDEADLEDAVSTILLQYVRLVLSGDEHKLELAIRMTGDPALKLIWVRSRLIDIIRRRRREQERTVPLGALSEGFGVRAGGAPSEVAAFWVAARDMALSLDPKSVETLEILVEAEIRGQKQGALAADHGIRPDVFAKRKRRLRKLLSG